MSEPSTPPPWGSGMPWAGVSTTPALRYDVVIVGHGLPAVALARSLAETQQISDVAVLAPGPLLGPIEAPPLAVIEPQHWWSVGAELGQESADIIAALAIEDGLVQSDLLTVATTEAELSEGRWLTELAKANGYRAETTSAETARRWIGSASGSVVGAQLWEGSGIGRVDLISAEFARRAHAGGVDLVESLPVTAVIVENGKVEGVRTGKGVVRASVVVACGPGWASVVMGMAGVEIPVTPQRIEWILTDPLPSRASGLEGVVRRQGQQTTVAPLPGGAVLISGPRSRLEGPAIVPTGAALEQIAVESLALLPSLDRLGIRCHWAGLVDQTPDGRPIVGPTGIDGLLCSTGWSGTLLCLAPAASAQLAAGIATNSQNRLLKALSPARFESTQVTA